MTLNFLEILIIVLSAVLILIIIFFVSLWRLKKIPFTRERFAFVGLTLLVSLIITLLPYLFGSNLALETLNLVSTLVFEHPIEISKPDFSDKTLAFLFVFFVGFVYIKIFKNWNGTKSVYQVELEKHKEHTNIFVDVKLILKGDERLRLYNPVIDEKTDFVLKEPVIDPIAWHEQVCELLTLSSVQYKFNIKKDWYQKEGCFISSYGKENQPLSVMCSLSLPSERKIIEFIRFSLKQLPSLTKTNETIFIVAVKNTENSHEIKTIDNKKVEIVSEDYLLDNLIDFSNYYTYIQEQFEDKEIINGYNYTLNDVYTLPSCKIKNRNKKEYIDIDNIEDYIINWVNEKKDKKQLSILGEYGQGKSVLSQRISYSIIKNNKLTNRIPLIIELRGRYPKQYPNSLALLSDWCSNFSINPKALLKLHHAGKLLIIFEGFDEMELIGDYEIRVDHFRKLWEFSTNNSKIIITGRPNFFLNDNELKTLLRTSTEYTNLSYCEEIYLKRFTLEQITDALRNAPNETRTDILAVLNEQSENSSFFDLMSRPSSLFLTSIVWKERNISKYKNNINSALVIEEFLKHSYSRQENKGVKSALSIYERAYFMQGIAIGMTLKNRYTNQISQSELKEIIIKLYNDFPEEITLQNINIEGYTKPIQKRFNTRYNEETILLDIRSCGVLVRDLSTFDSFKFAHKSFLELLVSDYITNSLVKTSDSDNTLIKIITNSISNALDCIPNQLAKTPDVIRFIAERSIRKLNLENENDDKEKIRIVFSHIYPFKHLSMEKVFKLIPWLGHNIKFGLFFMIQSLLFSSAASYSFYKIIYKLFSNSNINTLFVYLIIIVTLVVFFILSMWVFHRLFIRGSLFTNIFFSIPSKNYRIVLNDNFELLQFSELNVVNDRGNLLIIYLICKDLNLIDTLKNLMPKSLFSSIELQEKYFNRYKNGFFLTEDELISKAEELNK